MSNYVNYVNCNAYVKEAFSEIVVKYFGNL